MITRYGFKDAISGFFEFHTDNARRILPAGLEPVELRHGTSILAVTAFDFDESEVGTYGELCYAVLVMPLLRGGRIPKAAEYPWQVATTTAAARAHAIERWRLPHWPQDIAVGFERSPGRVTARVCADDAPAMQLTVTEHSWDEASHLYQSFQKDETGLYVADMLFEGILSEHEEETGNLLLHDCPFNRSIGLVELDPRPFREIWMRSGQQLFDPLTRLDA